MITILRRRVASKIWVCYLEGQGHSMTLQQNRVRPITWLFEVRFYNFHTEMITILRWRVGHNIWVATLKVKITAWPCSKIVSGPKLCYLKSDCTTVSQKWSAKLGWHVARNGLVATLKVEVTAWPCSKIVSGPLLCYLKSDFTTISQKWSPYWDYMSRATFWLLPWRSRSQHDLAEKWCPAHNFVIWSPILNLFYRNDHHIETPYRKPCSKNVFGP